MADNAAHIGKRWRYVVKLAAFVDIQQPDPIVLSYVNLVRFDKKTRVGAVAEILGQAKDGDFVFVWFALPRAELGAVTAFVAEGVKVQGLVAILEPGYGD